MCCCGDVTPGALFATTPAELLQISSSLWLPFRESVHLVLGGVFLFSCCLSTFPGLMVFFRNNLALLMLHPKQDSFSRNIFFFASRERVQARFALGPPSLLRPGHPQSFPPAPHFKPTLFPPLTLSSFLSSFPHPYRVSGKSADDLRLGL